MQKKATGHEEGDIFIDKVLKEEKQNLKVGNSRKYLEDSL